MGGSNLCWIYRWAVSDSLGRVNIISDRSIVMFWYIISIAILFGGLVALTLHDWEYDYKDDWEIPGGIFTAMGLMCLVFTISAQIDYKMQVETYPQRKAFYESVTAGSEYEDATFRKEKAELNDGLFEAQWYKEYVSFFSLWPDEVLELEPIN